MKRIILFAIATMFTAASAAAQDMPQVNAPTSQEAYIKALKSCVGCHAFVAQFNDRFSGKIRRDLTLAEIINYMEKLDRRPCGLSSGFSQTKVCLADPNFRPTLWLVSLDDGTLALPQDEPGARTVPAPAVENGKPQVISEPTLPTNKPIEDGVKNVRVSGEIIHHHKFDPLTGQMTPAPPPQPKGPRFYNWKRKSGKGIVIGGSILTVLIVRQCVTEGCWFMHQEVIYK